MLRKIRHFFKEYRQLGLVIVALIAGGTLDLLGKDTVSHIILGTTAIIAVIPLLWGMLQKLRSGEYGIDLLAATAIIVSVLLKEYWAGMVIVLMLTGGEALEDYAESRAKKELNALLNHKPKLAHLLKGKKLTDVPVKSVQIKDLLIVQPGEVIPVDAVIIEGSSSIDESSLTGEAIPVAATVGDNILSGAVNGEGVLTVRATATAANSQFEQIIKLVKSASASQSPFVRLADRYSIPFTLLSFAIAGAAWYIGKSPERFLEVLVVATPCPLLLGAPIALISGMGRAARNGIIVKTGSAMERLAEIRTVGFDKTGTLTRGVPVVDQITAFHGFTKTDVLSYAAALEQNSNHILGGAIIAKAQSQKLKVQAAKQIKETPGLGLSGRYTGKTILVGRLKYMEQEAVTLPTAYKADSVTSTASYVAVDGILAGVIGFTDKVRDESKETLARLKKAGITHTLMLTGDNKVSALSIAKPLGITDITADCMPADKLHAIDRVTDRPIAFVGDGVNDAPVLTAADIGIALGARGSTAASESADVVILQDDLSKVASSVEIAQRTFFIARQSILIGIFISIGLMIAFATGRFTAVQGAAIQELVDIIVIINALRANSAGKN